MTRIDKIAIVTGAGGGIGFSIVKNLIHSGYLVEACTKRNIDQLLSFKENIDKELKENLKIRTFDINNFNNVKENILSIYKTKKRIDILINCAGIPHGGLFNLTNIEDAKQIFDTNFFSQLYLTQLVSRLMGRNKQGVIINISSVTAFRNDPGTLTYGSSKAALNYATKILAKELSSTGIRVNAIAPGITNTPMLSLMDEKALTSQLSDSSNKSIAEPSQIASLVSFLCSDESSHINGQIIKIDGGQG
ncbi:SDR family NAD(P)-dependent oxidoreductase [Prochlorococcus marinus]|uniref:SDR family NAD(P)-dependent oxidoreductase n=1 Tax=Prochlorococcus marinus TaxID=1219 RepID=UPI0022B32526|nr:SDR family NAD(P)-dependent oxidoreductase [Prochlorococcus marinus]